MKRSIRMIMLGSTALAVLAAPTMANAGATEVASYLSGLFTGGALANAQQGGYNYVAPQTASVQPTCRVEKQWVFDPYVGAKIQKPVSVCG